MSGIVVSLPDRLRGELKEPFGPVYDDPGELLATAGEPLIAVGDVVTYHLERAGRTPDVSVVDGRTERGDLDPAVADALGATDVTVENPPATLTEALVSALREALGAEGPVRIGVEGEEDLAALPAILAAPDGASVVYGQPGEGMVHVRVTAEVEERVREIVGRMDGDPERLFSMIDER